MKSISIKNILIAVIILLLTMLSVMFSFKEASELSSKEVMAVVAAINNEKYAIQKYSEKYKKSNIEIYYPITKYEVLNKYVNDFVQDLVNNFKIDCDDEFEYKMIGNFDYVQYGDYMTFIFHTSEDFRGAHPIPNLYTITYNINSNSIVNIDTLIEENNNILNLLSKYSLDILLENKKIQEIGLKDLVISGTQPTKDNFRNIVFTKEGLKVLFMQYQVAPYAYGEFSSTIPYNKLDLKIN